MIIVALHFHTPFLYCFTIFNGRYPLYITAHNVTKKDGQSRAIKVTVCPGLGSVPNIEVS